ncbi:putative hydrolase, NUDIX family [Variovorax paradoxus B4]|uniref:Putative hydrolase, NUDIX family n=1 Tax=Variovorax paradoxus B4 TaxID=1246301 RepID=T1XKB4_VARPD|nr:NUDIX hydrolase [Variovorax paradoxus]AGU52996.1 putative hydrolase, NUDIX family [Variovorax paradoxus B4]
MKSISHGVLIVNANEELLLCHASGSPHWDIPKGGGKLTETGRQTVVRETFEECGLQLAPEDLLPLGCFASRPGKDLQLHAVLMARFDTHACVCRSQFADGHGQLRPEMDGYRWAAFDEVSQWCAKGLATLLTRTLSLPTILRQLQALKRQPSNVGRVA